MAVSVQKSLIALRPDSHPAAPARLGVLRNDQGMRERWISWRICETGFISLTILSDANEILTLRSRGVSGSIRSSSEQIENTTIGLV
ncbi:MAG: hypothetical protein HY911_07295 [Desulfobacterales bacterium]|nr:hypothetical protein [Desulfobacterales bacterium]